jgi:HK97 family phage portal protein
MGKVGTALARVVSSLTKAAEGQYRPGPYSLPVTGGWLPDGAAANFWQLGYDPFSNVGQSAMVEACISAYSQTIAMCPGSHWLANDKGGRERVTTSALSRILRKPNFYQSISDFMLNLTRSLYAEGNAYALALRNDRFEIDSLHLMNPRQSRPQLAKTGDIFYTLGGNDVIEHQLSGEKLIVPARDVLHVRLHCTRSPFPLIGESPLTAAMSDIGALDAITKQQTQFYLNQARPSAVLSTDLVLDKPSVDALRDRWNEQAKGLGGCGPGGVPILTAGLKVQPWNVTGKDAELAEVMRLSSQNIALAFRVPLQVLGIGGTPFSSTELLYQSWVASGLGFALNHIEESFGLLFALFGQPDEYCEFDTSALLRSAQKDRIETLTRAVQGGIMSPNEARAEEDMSEVKFGDEPRVQQQVVPLSAAGAIPAAPGPGAPPSALGQPAPTLGKPNGKPKPEQPIPAQKASRDDVQREVRKLRTAAQRIGRRFN